MSLESKIQEIGQKPLPAHVAVIMDGNGRWAKTRGLDRSMGHVEGVNAVRRITEIASDLGVKYLTLYTFSTENWNRPQEEVDALMHLISIAIERETPDLVRNNVRLKIIGDTKTVPDYVSTGCAGVRKRQPAARECGWCSPSATRRGGKSPTP